MKHQFNSLFSLAAIAGVIGASDSIAQAQGFPVKSVRIVVATAAGGSIDFVARLIAQELNKSWSMGVVVDNRAGAGSTIGTDIVAKSPPDGHTLAFVPQEFTTSAGVYTKLPYDPLRDFAPVTLLAYSAWILVVNPTLPARSIKELVALAKAKPGQINYASTGNGTGTHLAAELLKSMTATEIVHIPYKGTVPALTDVIAGQIGFTITGMAAGMPHVKSGKLRVLAVTGTNRSAVMPDLPTIGETVSGYESNNWFGVLVPRATPADSVAQLHASIVRALQTKEVTQLLLAQGIEPVGSSSAQFADTLRQEIGKYSRLAKEIGMRVD